MGDVYEEFEEEDVWSVMRERRESSSPVRGRRSREPSSPRAPRRLPAASAAGGGGVLRQSAPVNIPHWPNTHRTKKLSETHSYRDDREAAAIAGFGIDDDGDGDEQEGMVPPHEWIAQKLARSKISSSMCEGVGRTLKGRDLSKVRNAVLTRTGFLE